MLGIIQGPFKITAIWCDLVQCNVDGSYVEGPVPSVEKVSSVDTVNWRTERRWMLSPVGDLVGSDRRCRVAGRRSPVLGAGGQRLFRTQEDSRVGRRTRLISRGNFLLIEPGVSVLGVQKSCSDPALSLGEDFVWSPDYSS